LRGEASVLIDLTGGARSASRTCSPGMLFGEMAIVERRPRAASSATHGRVLALSTSDRLRSRRRIRISS